MLNFQKISTELLVYWILLEKEVSTSAVSGLQHTLSTSALTNGVYFVKVNDGTTSQIERIVVKK